MLTREFFVVRGVGGPPYPRVRKKFLARTKSCSRIFLCLTVPAGFDIRGPATRDTSVRHYHVRRSQDNSTIPDKLLESGRIEFRILLFLSREKAREEINFLIAPTAEFA